jgi:hypothetical protein
MESATRSEVTNGLDEGVTAASAWLADDSTAPGLLSPHALWLYGRLMLVEGIMIRSFKTLG